MQLRWNLIQDLFIEDHRIAREMSVLQVSVVKALTLPQSVSTLVNRQGRN
jgi:hypothetical protein